MTTAPTSTPTTPPSRKIGIRHIQLVYETVGERLQCRICLSFPHPHLLSLSGFFVYTSAPS
ncbi:hypothetical protein B0F90DRAFT_1769522, partial [Multifurca ochricompacta]